MVRYDNYLPLEGYTIQKSYVIVVYNEVRKFRVMMYPSLKL